MIKINVLNSYDKIELTIELTNELESKSINTVTTRLLSLHEAQKFRLELLKKRELNESSNTKILLIVNGHKFFLTIGQITFMIYRLKEQIDQLKTTQTQISELNAVVI